TIRNVSSAPSMPANVCRLTGNRCRRLTPRRAMADIPRRIQRRRTKGWRMPVGAIYVGRRYSVIGSGKWSNPFFIGGYFKRGDLVGDYRGPFRMLYSQRGIWRPEDIEAALREGYTL